MAILVVNAGSVTIKYRLFNNDLTPILSGILDNKNGRYVSEVVKDNNKYEWDITKEEFENAPRLILTECKDFNIEKIGFRVVHGGDEFSKPTILNENVINNLKKISVLAPLHNPPAIKIIEQFKSILKDIDFIAVFDTAFHSTMPAKAYMYALPYEYYSMYKVRRYGFHGISHNYVINRMKEILPQAKKIISCHLGGGASISAVLNGECIDTSMGFTPLEGLIMATRAGDVDDGAISYLQSITKFNDEDFSHIENHKSGLLGISGYTADMRKLLDDEKNGNERAHLAIEMYLYRIQKYIGTYVSVLDGLDALIITAGVGAGSDIIRRRIFEPLTYFNLRVDNKINDGKINVDKELKISAFGSTPIYIIPTNEELQIATQIKDL